MPKIISVDDIARLAGGESPESVLGNPDLFWSEITGLEVDALAEILKQAKLECEKSARWSYYTERGWAGQHLHVLLAKLEHRLAGDGRAGDPEADRAELDALGCIEAAQREMRLAVRWNAPSMNDTRAMDFLNKAREALGAEKARIAPTREEALREALANAEPEALVAYFLNSVEPLTVELLFGVPASLPRGR